MVKITLLGSCRHSPYEVLAKPDPIPGLHNTEEGYQIACKLFYPAIDNSDIVIVWAPDGVGEHTQRDMEYAMDQGKRIVVIKPEKVYMWQGWDMEYTDMLVLVDE